MKILIACVVLTLTCTGCNPLLWWLPPGWGCAPGDNRPTMFAKVTPATGYNRGK